MEHATRLLKMRNSHSILIIQYLKERSLFRDLSVDRRIILKWVINTALTGLGCLK